MLVSTEKFDFFVLSTTFRRVRNEKFAQRLLLANRRRRSKAKPVRGSCCAALPWYKFYFSLIQYKCTIELKLLQQKPEERKFCVPPAFIYRKVRYYALFCGFVHAGNGVKVAGIANVRQALGDDTEQKVLAVSDVHIALGVGDKLWFAAALRQQEAEGDHLALLQVESGAGIVVAEAVIRKPAVYVPGFTCFVHVLAEDFRLRGDAFFKAVFRGGGCLGGQRKRDAAHFKRGGSRLHKGEHTPISEVVRSLIDSFHDLNGGDAAVEGGGQHFGECAAPPQPIRAARMAI